MININGLSVLFSNAYILQDISFVINKGDRIGLVGKNGAGKTTLLRILKGIMQPDEGNVSYPKDTSIGFLPQEMSFKGSKSVFEETLKAFEKIIELKKNITKFEQELKEITDYSSDNYYELLQKLTDANDSFSMLGGHNVDAETEKILLGLGFTKEQLDMPVNTFSGGWRMRIELAKLLLQKPDLLLVDEPTNHLDIESIQWLENFLCRYHGAVVVVSHDRTFLDNVTNRTIEINLAKIFDYNVPYSTYIIKRTERIEQQKSRYENQQKTIEQTEKFIERFRYKATKSRQVQSRIKMLEKLDIVEVDDIDNSSIYVKFPPAPQSGKVVVEVQKLSKRYDTKSVLKNIEFIIDKGDKIAFVGKNGEGKTTLARIINKEIEFEGICNIGYNVAIGYYAQNETELLNPNKTVFETIDDIAVGDIRQKVRHILGSFLFRGDDIEKKVKVLSGGEKARLALAKLLLAPVNLLILDEPTNHLDMKAKEILKKALINYNGTLIVVSHDRHFLQGLTNKVFEFRHQCIKQYNGDVFDFLRTRNLESLQELEYKTKVIDSKETDSKTTSNKQQWEKKKETDRLIRKINSEIEKIETEISKAEFRMQEIEKILENPATDMTHDTYPKLFEEYQGLKKHNDLKLKDWEDLHRKLEILNTEK
ncbi:MAG: ABC-F family ATP-binding cassette domain-containing protein [Bacteroidales bacterium]|nr:ABC-F family ATP-binding cassette domain-containing protein [Bacteroidales bacterium]